MGSATTHFEISQYVVGQLDSVAPTGDDHRYHFLGNFLTDVSQLRDPFAFMHAKHAIRRGLGGFKATFASGYLDDLLGQAEPESRRVGALASYFEQLGLTFTLLVFADNSPLRSGHLGTVEDVIGVPVPKFTAAELISAYQTAFTQYYPHEHLDFPPYYNPTAIYGGKLGRVAVGAVGTLASYLEEQIQYVVEELTRLEFDWLRATAGGPGPARGPEIRMRLGHLLHTIEDFFFHSNFAEAYQWQRIASKFLTETGDPRLRSLDGTRDDARSIRLRRKYARRLRYPVFDGATPRADMYWDHPSTTASSDAAWLVYTGGFGSTDVFHSLSNGLKWINRLAALVTTSGNRGPSLVLWEIATNTAVRREAVFSTSRKDDLRIRHMEQLAGGEYQQGLDRSLQDGRLSKEMADSLKAAMEIDLDLQRTHGILVGGIGTFVIEFLVALQAEVDRSNSAVEALDHDERSILDTATVNGATAETIGTHSLLAKDDASEAPMRSVAVALAKHASASIAIELEKRIIGRGGGPALGVDWDSVVHHFLRFPRLARGSWEADVTAGAGSAQRSVSSIPDQPRYRVLGPDNQPEKLRRLRNGTARQTLEGAYRKMEAITDS